MLERTNAIALVQPLESSFNTAVNQQHTHTPRGPDEEVASALCTHYFLPHVCTEVCPYLVTAIFRIAHAPVIYFRKTKDATLVSQRVMDPVSAVGSLTWPVLLTGIRKAFSHNEVDVDGVKDLLSSYRSSREDWALYAKFDTHRRVDQHSLLQV